MYIDVVVELHHLLGQICSRFIIHIFYFQKKLALAGKHKLKQCCLRLIYSQHISSPIVAQSNLRTTNVLLKH